MEFNFKKHKIFKSIIVILLVIFFSFFIYLNLNKEERQFKVFDNIFKNDYNIDTSLVDNVTLVRSIDGDTAVFLVNGKEQKVRFLAIDTPETVKENTKIEEYGIEASNLTKKLLLNANEIKLEYEKLNDYDKYDRLLAYIFVDGKLLQEILVKEGLAKVAYIYGDYKYTDLLYNAQNEAKKNKVGIWK